MISRRFPLVRDERGFSLVFTLLTMLVTAVTLTSIVQYSTSNSRTSTRSKADQIAYSLAEAGLANGAAVLSKPANDALSAALLPSSEPDPANPAHANYIAQYDGGTVKWWGVLTGTQWLMHGVGIVTDPTGKTRPVRRQVTSTIRIAPTLSQALNSNAWNYLFAKNTGSACDVTLKSSVVIDTSLYVLGDLCFTSSSRVVKAAAPDLTNLYVGEHLKFESTSNYVGTSGSGRINQAQVGLGCRIGLTSGAYTSPCTPATQVNAMNVIAGTSPGTGPVADFDFWYANAKPGPTQFCGSGYSGISLTAFESSGSTTRNNSAGTFNLTPGSNYTCRYYDVAPNQTDLLGELSWNNATKVLTIKGAIYIDGSISANNGVTNRYQGLGTLYASGSFVIDGSTQLCGAVTSGNCNFATWDPNVNNIGIVANGAGNSVSMLSSTRFQGSVYATNTFLAGSSVHFDGPAVAGTFDFDSSIQTHEFPTITTVPIGWPGNPNVYAEPQPPKNYSG